MATIKKYIIILALIPLLMESQTFGDKGLSAHSAAMGRSVVAMTNHPLLQFYNPAAIGNAKNLAVASTYTQLYPLLNSAEFGVLTFAGSYGLEHIGAVGIGISQFAPSLWSERMMSGSFASTVLHDNVSVGVTLKVLTWSSESPQGENAIPEPGLSYNGITFDAGVQWLLPEVVEENDIRLGFSALNVTQPSIAHNNSPAAALPIQILFGGAYISRKYNYGLMPSVSVQDGNIKIMFGSEISALRSTLGGINTEFIVRAGGGRLTEEDSQGDYNFGFGINIEKFTLDYSYTYQAEVRNIGGITSITLGYSF